VSVPERGRRTSKAGADLALLDRTREVEIETRSRSGAVHRVIIWVVVADGVPYVASYLGRRGRWWRELLARGDGALLVGRRRIPVRPHRVRSPATKRVVSQAYAAKYPRSQSLVAMQQREVLDTTLRLELGS
jgi:hypothetical protein